MSEVAVNWFAYRNEVVEIIRGRGNVFRDFGCSNADREQLRCTLAAKIIGVLDDRALSLRQAEAETGISHSEFARLRRAKSGRFTIDRLMTILNHLNQRVEVRISPAEAPPDIALEARERP